MNLDTRTRNQESVVTVTCVRFELRDETWGSGPTRPQISWICQTTQIDWQQTGYQIIASSLDRQLWYLTGCIESNQSELVPWPFTALSSGERRLVRVRVWGNDGQVSDWSAPSPVEAGILSEDSSRSASSDLISGKGRAQ